MNKQEEPKRLSKDALTGLVVVSNLTNLNSIVSVPNTTLSMLLGEIQDSRSEIARLTAENERLRGEWKEGWGLLNLTSGDLYADYEGVPTYHSKEEAEEDLRDAYEPHFQAGWKVVPVRYRDRVVELIETKEPV